MPEGGYGQVLRLCSQDGKGKDSTLHFCSRKMNTIAYLYVSGKQYTVHHACFYLKKSRRKIKEYVLQCVYFYYLTHYLLHQSILHSHICLLLGSLVNVLFIIVAFR